MICRVINTHGDVWRLLADAIEYCTGVAVETTLRIVVADIVYNTAHDVFNVDVGICCYLSGNNDHASLNHGLAGYSGAFILLKQSIQDCIGDLVGHFIRVALRY